MSRLAAVSGSDQRPRAASAAIDYDQIITYLVSLGISETDARAAPTSFKSLQELAKAHGGDLKRSADVEAAAVAAKLAAKLASLDRRRAKLKPLAEKERQRLRLAFDHFDVDNSGRLDMDEFRNAMIDCGMMPLGFEVQKLFDEADEDGSEDVDFDEYCNFIQLYRQKQNPCERFVECFLDLVTPRAAYLTDQSVPFVLKMRAEGCSTAAIAAFQYNYSRLLATQSGRESLLISELDIWPVSDLPSLEGLRRDELGSASSASLLEQTVIVKLNGGLGTGMGLEKAKSLLPVKGANTFLDFIALQVLHLRASHDVPLAFLLMNSFATSADSMAHLAKYAGLASAGLDLEFLQNKAPKVDAKSLGPAAWPAQPELEWCPPGHGDLYAALVGSGTLDSLLERGLKYMFVSNSDNLGATLDLSLLRYFAASRAPFLMEVADRTDADKKGGHLARHAKGTKGLLLRESAQCADSDEAYFQDVSKHRYFNTNNLWIDLAALKAAFAKHKGVLPLPVMKNVKTVDPRDKDSRAVLQLETAMGAAIECFEGARAIVVPRSRFAPVKTTADLLALSSDAYEQTDDHRMVLRPTRRGVPPTIKLDAAFKFVDGLERLVPFGPPSLIACKKLTIKGKVRLDRGVVFEGTVIVENASSTDWKLLPGGVYCDEEIELP